MTRMTLMGATMTAALVLSGCGVASAAASPISHPHNGSRATAPSSPTAHGASSRSTPSSPPANTTTVTLGKVSLSIPGKGWTLTAVSAPEPGATEVQGSGQHGNTISLEEMKPALGNDLVLLPLLPRPQGLTKNPLNQSPYFSESRQIALGQIQDTWSEVTASGAEYVVNLDIDQNEAVLAKTILHSVKAPSPITVTEDVHLIQKRPSKESALSEVHATLGQDRWILVGGQAAMAQEEWYLFRSANGGQQWSLINSTHFTVRHSVFPESVGSPSMLFWSRDDGIIVQPSYAASSLLVYRTTNGGSSWLLTTVPYKSGLAVFAAPKLERASDGTLTMRAELTSKKTVELVSQDGGIKWSSAVH